MALSQQGLRGQCPHCPVLLSLRPRSRLLPHCPGPVCSPERRGVCVRRVCAGRPPWDGCVTAGGRLPGGFPCRETLCAWSLRSTLPPARTEPGVGTQTAGARVPVRREGTRGRPRGTQQCARTRANPSPSGHAWPPQADAGAHRGPGRSGCRSCGSGCGSAHMQSPGVSEPSSETLRPFASAAPATTRPADLAGRPFGEPCPELTRGRGEARGAGARGAGRSVRCARWLRVSFKPRCLGCLCHLRCHMLSPDNKTLGQTASPLDLASAWPP